MFKHFNFNDDKWAPGAGTSHVQGCVGESQAELRNLFNVTNLNVKTTSIDYTVAGDLPANCGLVVVNLAVLPTTNNTAGVKTFGCGYCKPGYKSVGADVVTDSYPFVRQCVKIDNCADSNKTVNACEKCVNEFGFAMDATNGTIDNTACVKMTGDVSVPSNCMVFKETKCVICNKNFSVTLDGTCQKLTMAQCGQTDFVVFNKYLHTNFSENENENKNEF